MKVVMFERPDESTVGFYIPDRGIVLERGDIPQPTPQNKHTYIIIEPVDRRVYDALTIGRQTNSPLTSVREIDYNPRRIDALVDNFRALKAASKDMDEIEGDIDSINLVIEPSVHQTREDLLNEDIDVSSYIFRVQERIDKEVERILETRNRRL